jgi:hypothetical protein
MRFQHISVIDLPQVCNVRAAEFIVSEVTGVSIAVIIPDGDYFQGNSSVLRLMNGISNKELISQTFSSIAHNRNCYLWRL